MTFQTLKTLNLQQTGPLRVVNGHIDVDIAVWLRLETPSLLTSGQLLVRYVDGKSMNTQVLDTLTNPTKESALLSARLKLPIALKNTPVELGVDINGSRFKLDSIHCSPINAKPQANSAPLYVA